MICSETSWAATYTVTNTADSGAGSLRQAITSANGNAGADTIQFSIASGVQTITPASVLPTITEAVIIDGWSQPGYIGTPLIELNGASTGGANGLTLAAGSGGSTIRGLVINRFNDAVVVQSSNNTIVGNYMGTDPTGLIARPNATYTLYLLDAANNTIGGLTSAERNIISGNSWYGIWISGSGSNGNVIIGNYIGADATGAATLGNGIIGIIFYNPGTGDPHDNRVGGTTAAEGNLIVANGSAGVVLYDNSPTEVGMTILGNSIYANGGLGIDLGNNGVTLNDACDADTGANHLQNFPVLASAATAGSQITITGSLNSTANSYFRIEFFANSAADPTGYGEGQRYLGFVNVATDGSCNATINTTLTAAVAVGEFVSATATKTNATYTTFTDTSEFALDRTATAATYSIAGRVFEDFAFGGTAAEWDGGINHLGLVNVAVELYNNANTYLTTTTTAADGSYSFTGLANGTYKVRVRSATIGDADTPPRGGFTACVPGTCAYPIPAMTWGNGAARYGGQSPTVDDTATAATAGPGNTYLSVTVSGASVANVNFGFAYNLIVSTDDDNNNATTRSKAGMLRQFIKNANAIGVAGATTANYSQFRMQVAANQTSGGDTWWRITPGSALPTLTDNGTTIDGSTQTTNQGDTNSKGPEIEIFGNGIAASGLSVSGATGVTIKNIVINSFTGTGIYINNATNSMVTGCYIGTNGTASAVLGNNLDGIQIDGTSSGSVIGGASAGAGNIISGSSGRNGIYLSGTSTGAVIKGNKIGTGYTGTENLANLQGIYVFTSAAATNNIIGGVYAGEGNVVAYSVNSGIELIQSGTGDKVLGNTVRNGGAGGTAAIYSNVPGGYIAKNTIYSYNGAGISLTATANNGKIYQNTIHGNIGGTGNGISISGPTGVVIKNNLMTNNSGWGISSSVAITTGNNDYFSNAAGTCTATSGCPGSGSINADPLYVNAAGGDFHLTECTSPAINQGIDLGVDQPDMNGAAAGLWNNNAPEMGAFETTGSCAPSLALVKQAWDLNGAAPLTSPTAPVGYTIVFLIYVKNTTAGPVTDLRINDSLDETAFQYVSGSLVRTSVAAPPADTATDKQIFDATDPGTGTVLSDALDGDVGSAQDTAAPAGVDRITIGAVTGQANGNLTINAHAAFAVRFNVKIK